MRVIKIDFYNQFMRFLFKQILFRIIYSSGLCDIIHQHITMQAADKQSLSIIEFLQKF